MIFGGFAEFGLGLGNIEKSRFLSIFGQVGFGADLDRVKSVQDRSGCKSCAEMCVWVCEFDAWRSSFSFFHDFWRNLRVWLDSGKL